MKKSKLISIVIAIICVLVVGAYTLQSLKQPFSFGSANGDSISKTIYGSKLSDGTLVYENVSTTDYTQNISDSVHTGYDYKDVQLNLCWKTSSTESIMSVIYQTSPDNVNWYNINQLTNGLSVSNDSGNVALVASSTQVNTEECYTSPVFSYGIIDSSSDETITYGTGLNANYLRFVLSASGTTTPIAIFAEVTAN